MSSGSILSWFADWRYAHISIWSKTGLQEVKPFSISFGQRSCDVKLPRRVSSRHVVCGSNIAGGSGWGSLISASIAVIGWAWTIAAASDIRVSCSSWVSYCVPNSNSMASSVHPMVPICRSNAPPKEGVWGGLNKHSYLCSGKYLATDCVSISVWAWSISVFAATKLIPGLYLSCKAEPLMAKNALGGKGVK